MNELIRKIGKIIDEVKELETKIEDTEKEIAEAEKNKSHSLDWYANTGALYHKLGNLKESLNAKRRLLR